MDCKLTKKERLKGKAPIEQLFKEGQSITNFPLKLVYLPMAHTDGASIKILVVAPKRNFKRAVDRNRIKRLLREAYRLNKHLFLNKADGKFALAFLFLGKSMPDYPFVEKKMIGILEGFVEKVCQ